MWTLFSQSRSKYKVCKKSAVWEKRMNKVIMQKVTAKNIFKQKVQLDIMPTVLLWLALLGEKKKNCVSVNSSLSCSKCILFCFFCWVLLVKKKKKTENCRSADGNACVSVMNGLLWEPYMCLLMEKPGWKRQMCWLLFRSHLQQCTATPHLFFCSCRVLKCPFCTQ